MLDEFYLHVFSEVKSSMFVLFIFFKDRERVRKFKINF